MGPTTVVSGGSAANTMAGVAVSGRAAFVGKVKDDDAGREFAHDIRKAGVGFDTPFAADGAATARCLIFVTPDGQRTMNTFLGACQALGPADIDDTLAATPRCCTWRVICGTRRRPNPLSSRPPRLAARMAARWR